MKILMFNNEFPPLGGGMGTVNQELFRQFAQYDNLQIDLFTSSLDKKSYVEAFSPTIRLIKSPVNNQNIHHSSGKELLSYTWQAFLAAAKYHRKEKYEVCMAWSTLPAGWNAMFFKFFFGVPFLTRISGPDIPYYEDRHKAIYPILTPIIKRIWRSADQVVTKCQQETDRIREFDQKCKITTINNAIDHDRFCPNPNRHFEGILEILCVARLVKIKGLDTMLHALKILQKKEIFFRLNLVGTGDDEAFLKQLTQELQLKNYVRFSGYVARENIPDEYDKAHIFALPSYKEGMSNAMLEAMGAGLPLLVTRTAGAEEFMQNSLLGYDFEAGNAEQAAECLEKMHQNRQLLQVMAENSRKQAIENSWEKIAERYIELFRKIKIDKKYA